MLLLVKSLFQSRTGTASSHNRQHGSVLTEAAIILPILATLVFGIIQYGLVISAQVAIKNANVVAVRTAILDGSTTQNIIDAARAAITTPLVPGQLNVSVVAGTASDGQPIKTISLSYNYPIFLRFVVPGAAGGVLALNSSAVVR